MNQKQPKKSFSDSDICRNEVKTNQEKELVKQNTRILAQTLLGCRKNWAECQAEEKEGEEESHE